ncbi:MAG: hypothetical protein RR986_01640 [Longicatena sp.]
MKKLWKDIVIICCFVIIFSLLTVEHFQFIANQVVKEIPYIAMLVLVVMFVTWITQKAKAIRAHYEITQKVQDICDQHALEDMPSDNTALYYLNILDQLNTLLKQNERTLYDFEHRYRLVATITNDVLFEYNIRNQTICDSSDWRAIASGEAFIQQNIERAIVHKDDVDEYLSFFKDDLIPNKIKEIEIHLKNNVHDDYHVTLLRGVVLAGIDGQAEKIIGCTSIIHDSL